MVARHPNFGSYVHSFKFSDDLENSVGRNLDVYASLYSKLSNVSSVVEYALNVNDYNRPSQDESQPSFDKSVKSMLDFRVLYLVIKPNLVISIEHVLHSIARALVNVLNGKSVSSNFTTEVAFMMSGSSNVGKCIDNVLVSRNDKSPSVLIVTISQYKVSETLLDVVEGVKDDISNLHKYTRVDEILKVSLLTTQLRHR
ncbi:hypothetical protein MACJ_003372 [Theileria orientalis]|uniref:Uncharacterized protein n=1 Tax=Theileria orientalis TaxID=68886 RepID=A0A976SK70_THEOR|nr:hypothetical protein MACJ_003372 [Theileria orientalis]